MARYINADLLANVMYHKAFEMDTDLQRWDSGCWIRYMMFQDSLEEAPTVDLSDVFTETERYTISKIFRHYFSDASIKEIADHDEVCKDIFEKVGLLKGDKHE